LHSGVNYGSIEAHLRRHLLLRIGSLPYTLLTKLFDLVMSHQTTEKQINRIVVSRGNYMIQIIIKIYLKLIYINKQTKSHSFKNEPKLIYSKLIANPINFAISLARSVTINF
jgi:hypothetical protein